MKTCKHTSGDWGVATVNNGSDDDEIVTIVNGCMVNVAAVFGAGEYSEARPNGEKEPHYKVDSEEAEANARLIAAAPELLEALAAMETWSGFVTDLMPENLRATWEEDIADARAAIAKATGEQP